MKLSLETVAFLAFSCALPLFAHHSFAAEFDDKKPVKMTGTLVKVEWQNPHIWFYLAVKNPDGTISRHCLSSAAEVDALMNRAAKGAEQ